jgi:hypothetical protein
MRGMPMNAQLIYIIINWSNFLQNPSNTLLEHFRDKMLEQQQ